MLCENPWEGGGGYTPQQVADMTPDQIYFRLCDKNLLTDVREKKYSSETGSIVEIQDDDGLIKGRLKDGTVVRMPTSIDGKSVAQRLHDEAAKKRAEEKKNKGKKK